MFILTDDFILRGNISVKPECITMTIVVYSANKSGLMLYWTPIYCHHVSAHYRHTKYG